MREGKKSCRGEYQSEMSIPTNEQAIFVLFGATGDLAKRKLYPALYSLYQESKLAENTQIIGVGRREWTQEVYAAHIKESLESFSKYKLDDYEDFVQHFCYKSLDIDQPDHFTSLLELIKTLEEKHQIPQNRLFYLAIAPELFESVAFNLQRQKLLDTAGWKRLVIEKPFGHDYRSAQDLNNNITKVFNEEEIYRIDHYLGKEMVQNIEMIRFANSLFEPVWNSRYIANVQITSSETVGIESRAAFYEKVGALRDMVQNHMLQMVTMIAMEPPSRLTSEAVRDEKVKVLRSVRIWQTEKEIEDNVVRGQYLAGQLKGKEIKGYRQEENVSPESKTETFLAARVMIENFRWSGVPFFIRTGKRLPQKATEIVVEFKNVFNLYYNKQENLNPNLLVIRIFPDEGIHISLNAKQPGDGNIAPITMDFCHNCEAGVRYPEAYERLLKDAIAGDSTYFTRWDEVSLAWQIVDPIMEQWQNTNIPLHTYEAGEWGPEAANLLVQREGFKWWPVNG